MKAALKQARPRPYAGRQTAATTRQSLSCISGGPRRPGDCCGRSRHGSVLVAVLWCLVLLSLVVVGVLHTARMDLVLVKHYGDRIQARYLAVAGVEKAKALLFQDARQRSRNGQNYSGKLSDAPDQLRDVSLGRGRFSVMHRAKPEQGGGVLFGVGDEEALLNLNYASSNELSQIEGVTPDVVASILDWRDPDNTVSPDGAESEYYMAFQPPYLPRNGPIQTIRELLMVRGITSEALLGRDRHENGLLDSAEAASNETVSDTRDLGWAGLLTVDSSIDNVNAAGLERVNIQSADEAALTGVKGITSDIAKAIVAYRGQNRFNSIVDLLDVVAAPNQNGAGGTPPPAQANGVTQNGPGAGPPGAAPGGPKVISSDLLMDIADDVTVESDSELRGLININSAGVEVLACLAGVSRELAQAIISFRQSNGFLPNIAWLLKVPGMTNDILKQIAPRICARSETFRILSEGQVKSTGAKQRIREIVHVGLTSVTTVSYREDDL